MMTLHNQLSRTLLFLEIVIISVSLSVYSRTRIAGTITDLMGLVSSAVSGDTILLRDGVYRVNNGYGIQVRSSGIAIKSLSNDKTKVIIEGEGMRGEVDYGFWIPGHHVTIQGLTIQNVANHCIQTDVNNRGLRVIDCILRDAYEQLLKVPAGTEKSDSGLVENCLFEFTEGVAENYYTGGIDVHRGKDWVVRNNTFKNIRSPSGSLAEHAIHFWNNSENILVEKNLIHDCDRGIGFGLGNTARHQGGIIRNNMIFHRAYPSGTTDFGDVGIGLEYCESTQVYNNSIYFDNNYANAIEYRWSGTKDVYIVNNLTNREIRQRDGASGVVTGNVTSAQPGWFRSAATGDLHLASGTLGSVSDKGVVVNMLTDDFDGNSRPQGVACDIGADEYTSSLIRNRIVSCPDPGIINSPKKLYTKNLGFSCIRSTDNTILFNINGVYNNTRGKWLIIIKKR